MTPEGLPTGWRDVYLLVRDTRSDVLGAVSEVDDKVSDLQKRVEVIEVDRLTATSAKDAEKRIFGKAQHMVVSTVALAVSILTGVGAFLAIVTH